MGDGTARTARRVLVLSGSGLAAAAAALPPLPWLPWLRYLAAAGLACYLAGAAVALRSAISLLRAKPPRSAPPWAFALGNAWLLIALAADAAGLAAGPVAADRVLGDLLVPALVLGVIAQTLIGALTFLLPVTVGGGPAGNRRLSRLLELAWPARLALGNAGVAALLIPGAPGWARLAAWTGVLAGFGTFPLLAAVALISARVSRAPR